MEWNVGNVQKWLLWTEHLYRLPHAGRTFQELTGKDLCAMSEEDFRQRSPQCGDTLHAHLDIWKSSESLNRHSSTVTLTAPKLASTLCSCLDEREVHNWRQQKSRYVAKYTRRQHLMCISI